MSHLPSGAQPPGSPSNALAPPPPAGGFGAPQPYGLAPGGPIPVPPAKTSAGLVIAIVAGVVLLGIIAIVAVLAVLGVYGTRKYIANAKTAEARNSLGRMAKDAVAAYEGDSLGGPAESEMPSRGVVRRLCPSARAPVPAALHAVSGKKWQSSPSDWKNDPGFSCLHFEVYSPQYYQYDYTNTGNGFTGTARGDLDGDNVPATFQLKGQLVDDALVVAPSIEETNPDE
jgi:type IV pilus assembly protein PilA